MIDQYRHWIEDALAYSGGTHGFEDVRNAVSTGAMQIWPAAKGVAITEIVNYPRKRVLHIFLAAGEMDQLTDMIDAAVNWGRSQGCTGLTMAGRLGWRRVLVKHGFQERLTVMERAI